MRGYLQISGHTEWHNSPWLHFAMTPVVGPFWRRHEKKPSSGIRPQSFVSYNISHAYPPILVPLHGAMALLFAAFWVSVSAMIWVGNLVSLATYGIVAPFLVR